MSWLPEAIRARPWFQRARRTVRRLRTYVTGPKHPLIYHLEYRSPHNDLSDRHRAEKILGHLLREGHLSPRHVTRPGFLALKELALIHDPQYLQSLDEPEVLTRIFGEHLPHLDTDLLVAQQRHMVAGTILATQMALEPPGPGRLVVNLGGGSHHAHRNQGGGFCIFNDVAIAIARLRADGYRQRVLVIDLDLHQGDGTRRIFADDESVFTFSIHATDWDAEPAVADLNVPLGAAVGDRIYLDALRTYVPQALAESRPALVFYVAGVDVAIDDQLGSWRVTPSAILERDQLVLRHIGDRPAVWVLAGGYGQDAWRHTARSLAWMLGRDDRPIPSQRERAIVHFRRIARQFEPGELSREPESTDTILTMSDILADLAPERSHRRLLGYYSRYGIECALESYGVLAHLRELGYAATRVEFDLEQATGHLARLYSRDGRRDLLIELVVKESLDIAPHRLLSIEWLMLQNPRAQPTPERPLLPGQNHPGLGCLRHIVMMLMMACERLGFDGLLFSPSHFHVAALARGLLAFVDPTREARFLAIEEALAGVPLAEATQIVHEGGLVDANTGETVTWPAAPMVLPVSQALKDAIEGPEYEQRVHEAAEHLRYRRGERGKEGEEAKAE